MLSHRLIASFEHTQIAVLTFNLANSASDHTAATTFINRRECVSIQNSSPWSDTFHFDTFLYPLHHFLLIGGSTLAVDLDVLVVASKDTVTGVTY